METKKLEILVVEDNKENIKAVNEFFETVPEVMVDYAKNYEEGIKKLQENLYAGAIFDLELPRTEGTATEKLGYELAKEAIKQKLPYVILTAFWHGGEHSKILVYEEGADEDVEIKQGPKKNSSEAWKEAYLTLKEIGNIEEIYEAKLRYKKFTGKDFGK